MDAEREASGKLLQEKTNGVYAPTTVQKASLFIRKFQKSEKCFVFNEFLEKAYNIHIPVNRKNASEKCYTWRRKRI